MEKLESKKGGKALYVQIKDIYRRKILSGELQPGDKIESEMEIQKMYGVSRITARQAILDLEKEGMVNRGRGRGTFVIWKPAIKEPLTGIRSFTDEMTANGRVPGTASCWSGFECMDERMASLFNVDPSEQMYCVKRVRTADDIKLVYMISYFPQETNAGKPYEGGSLYKRQGLPNRVEEEFGAQLPDEDVLHSLNIPKTLPVVTRKRIGYDHKNEVIEYTLCFYRSDLYSYTHSCTN